MLIYIIKNNVKMFSFLNHDLRNPENITIIDFDKILFLPFLRNFCKFSLSIKTKLWEKSIKYYTNKWVNMNWSTILLEF